MNTGNISFSEKKVSRNAFFTFLMGIIILVLFCILVLVSIVTAGGLGVAGGLLGCILTILAFFCVLWGLLSYDEAKTTQHYKMAGICINIVAIFIGITFVMM